MIGAIILSINIQVGLNMHLYDGIEDASSSFRGLISSFELLQNNFIVKKTYGSCTSLLAATSSSRNSYPLVVVVEDQWCCYL